MEWVVLLVACGIIKMTTIKKQYDIINYILWILKFPEIGLTIGTIVGFIACALGIIPLDIPLWLLVARVILFPIRFYFVIKKRKLERSNPSLIRSKKEYVFKYN
jgi:hypothetical protein